ncbi:MAG: autoinducer binding domain-containing protein [Pseudomonadota bacterium]
MWDGALPEGTSTERLSANTDAWFYEQIAETQSLSRKLELLWDMAQNLGFSDIFYCRLNDPLSASPLNHANVNEYRFGNATWHDLYKNEQYARSDWAIEQASWAQHWFRLDEPPSNLTPKQEKFLDHAREHNRQNGFCFPLNTSAGLHGGFSATGCDRTVSHVQILQMTSALQIAELTINENRQNEVCAQHGLTAREIKDLRMYVAGRSMSQIAHITGKSDQWIRLSFQKVRKKLGVATNAQLIHRATKMGLI